MASLCQGEPVWEKNKCGREESESASPAGRLLLPPSSWSGKWEEDEAGSTRAGGAQNSQSPGAKKQASLIYACTFLCAL